MDGIVYGSALGFGFAIAEDLLYGLQYGPETFVVRRIFGGFAHASFTSLTGIGIGLIPWVRNRALKVRNATDPAKVPGVIQTQRCRAAGPTLKVRARLASTVRKTATPRMAVASPAAGLSG